MTTVFRKFIGYAKKEPSKLPDGLHTSMKDVDIRNFNLIPTKSLSTATIDGATFANTGLTGINDFFKFEAGQPSEDIKYLCRDGNKLMEWDATTRTWSQIDSALSNTLTSAYFVSRNNTCVIGAGYTASNKPEWYGYVPDRWVYAYNGTGLTYTQNDGGFVAAEANLYTPASSYMDTVSNFSSATWTLGIAGSTVGQIVRYYKIALQYDNSQWTLPSAEKSVLLDTTNISLNTIQLLFNPSSLNKRVTAFRLYASSDNTNYYRIAEIGVNDQITYLHDLYTSLWGVGNVLGIGASVSGSYNNTTGYFTAGAAQDWVADLFNGFVATLPFGTATNAERILDTTMTGNGELLLRSGQGYTATNLQIGSTWWWDGTYYRYTVLDLMDDLTALPEMWTDLGYYSGEDITANYKYAAVGSGRQFIGKVYKNGETYLSRIYFSEITPSGAYAYDVFRDANYIDVDALGVHNIQGLMCDSQKLYIFGEDNIAILQINIGTFSWQLYKLIQNIGCVAPKSIMKIPDGKYAGGYGYLAKDGYRVLFGGYSYLISEDITDKDNYPIEATTLSEAIAAYDETARYIMLMFPSDGRQYCYSLLTNGWTIKELGAISNVGLDDDNNLLVVSGTGLYNISGTSTATASLITSTIFNDKEVILQRIGLQYKSSGNVTIVCYVDEDYFTITLGTSTDVFTPVYKLCPYGYRGRQIYLVISGFDELASIFVEYKEKKAP